MRSIAGSSWRGACRGIVHTVLGRSYTGFRTSRSETFESLKGVREQGRRKAQTTRDAHRPRARDVGRWTSPQTVHQRCHRGSCDR